MSRPARPKGDCRRAEPEGPVGPHGRPKGGTPRAQCEGSPVSKAGQPDRVRRGLPALAAAALAAPAAAQGQAQAPVRWRFQSTWPPGEFHEYALDVARAINEMTTGRLHIEMLPAGAVVPAFSVLDAVHRGDIDGSHNVPAYWVGKNPAFGLFGAGPSFGMDAQMLLGWMDHGGGKDLYDELYQRVMKFNVQGFLYGSFPTQPLGWFRKDIRSPDDFKGLRYRTSGLAVDLFKAMGAEVISVPAAQILEAIRDKSIDAAEFATATADSELGLPGALPVYMVQSYHQPLECFELLINRSKFAALAPELQAMVRTGIRAATVSMWTKAMHRNAEDYQRIRGTRGVRSIRTPPAVLRAQLQAWDRVIAARSIDNPFFARIIESQKRWAVRVLAWHQDFTVRSDMAFEHHFLRK